MKQKTIIASLLISALLAPAVVKAHGRHGADRHHCCCCCCCKPDQRPPKDKGMPSFITDKQIKKLALTDDQVTKLKAEEKAFMEKMEAMRPDSDSAERPSPDEMKEKMDAMMSEHEAAVKKLLSDEQYKKYQKYMEDNRPKGPRGGGPDAPDGPGGPEGEW